MRGMDPHELIFGQIDGNFFLNVAIVFKMSICIGLIENSLLSLCVTAFALFAHTPFPVADFRHVFSVFVDVGLVVQQIVAKKLFGVGGAWTQTRHTVDDIAGQVKAVKIVQYHHVKGVVVVPSSLYPRTCKLM
jgi:hypothetical protein